MYYISTFILFISGFLIKCHEQQINIDMNVDISDYITKVSIPTVDRNSMQHFQVFHIENTSMHNNTPDMQYTPQTDGADFNLRKYSLPIVFVIGMVGNTLSMTLFFGKSLRGYSCCILLGARSISDNGFLLTLFVVWLDFLDVRIFHTSGLCQIVVFLAYICSFLSVWCVVCVTIENYVRVSYPLLVKPYCTPKNAIIVLCLLVFASCCIYNIPLWSNEIVEMFESYYCYPKNEFEHLQLVLTYIDAATTLIIPLVVIIVLLTIIFFKGIEASKRKLRLGRHRRKYRLSPAYGSVAGLLTAVSITFILLHTPIHIFKLKVIIETVSGTYEKPSTTARAVGNVFLVMYYLNSSINILVYYICGSNFRKVCKEFCFCNVLLCNCDEEFEEDRISEAGTTELTVILDHGSIRSN